MKIAPVIFIIELYPRSALTVRSFRYMLLIFFLMYMLEAILSLRCTTLCLLLALYSISYIKVVSERAFIKRHFTFKM